MKTYALAARQYRFATWLAASAWPRTGPPETAESFRPSDMDGADLIYVCCHGLPDQGWWYGDRMESIASADQVRLCRIEGAICYLAQCYGIGPMSDALLEAGAACVVADADVTHSGFFLPKGANALGRMFVRNLKLGAPAGEALGAAKMEYGRRNTKSQDVALLATVSLVGDSGATLRGAA